MEVFLSNCTHRVLRPAYMSASDTVDTTFLSNCTHRVLRLRYSPKKPLSGLCFLSNCTHRVLRPALAYHPYLFFGTSYLIALIEYCDLSIVMTTFAASSDFLSNCTHRVLRHEPFNQLLNCGGLLI